MHRGPWIKPQLREINLSTEIGMYYDRDSDPAGPDWGDAADDLRIGSSDHLGITPRATSQPSVPHGSEA